MSNSLENVVIVGGGTAGWLTALYAKLKLPHSNVTVIESESLGILGAGEGTTPAFLEFLDVLGVPFSRLVKQADSTVKHGIKFSGWGDKDSYYYHGFFSAPELALNALDSPTVLNKSNALLCYLQQNSIPLNEATFPRKLSDAGKVGFYLYEDYRGQFVADPIHKYDSKSYFSAHINARKLADLLKTIAVDERRINRVEGLVSEALQNDSGDIYEIRLEDGQSISCDFVFDCTGFSGIFSKKIYQSRWVSFEDHLTVDSAQTFFLPISEQDEIPPHTESIAFNYGWAWKIPLQTRYGCGYVYDSSHLSEEEARHEIVSFFGEEVDFGKKISFSPGYLEKPWNNNCIAVGLSSGFIEPLEATAIWTSIIAIRDSLSDLRALAERSATDIERFNENMRKVNEEVFSFVYFHYVCGREDNDFWKHYTIDNGPQALKDILGAWDKTALDYRDFKSMFPLESWIAVAEGLNQINSDLYRRIYEHNFKMFESELESFYTNYIQHQDNIVSRCISHREFLEDLK